MAELLVLPDEYIEHWGIIFVSNKLFNKGIVFAAFLLSPHEFLESATFDKPIPCHGDYYPLLPSQLAVKAQLDKDEVAELMQDEMEKRAERQGHAVEMHGDRNIEPLHKRDPAKRWKTNTRRKG